MRIGLCGTMSVGKTTLVNALKELPEFKDYTFRTERSKYLMEQGIPLNTDSTLKGQIVFLAERAMELIQENIITDRTVIDVMAFAVASKTINYIDKESFTDFARNLIPEYDHIFYVSPEGVEMENNGVRETDLEYRNLIDFTINHLIKSNKHRMQNFHSISGTTENRIQQIKEALSL